MRDARARLSPLSAGEDDLPQVPQAWAIDHTEDQHRGISQGSVPAPKVSLKLKGERIDAAPPHVSRTTRNRADSRPTWTPYQALIAPAVGHTDST